VTAAQTPTENEILAVASIWRATRREVITSFKGTSMLPTIAPGVEVVLDCGREWQVGDIIAFQDSGHLGVHRIMAASPDRRWVLTRGDRRIAPDDPFEAGDAVIGVITRVRAGEAWVDPSPAQKSWLRDCVLSIAIRAFSVSPDACKRRLRVLKTIEWFVQIPRRIIGKVQRLLGLRS
jgi:hypothetical protein